MKDGYIDFDEYIRQGEPDKREKATLWRTAIGLQAVDGLKTSEYLKETARKHIEGEIDIDQARELIKSYYQSKQSREPDDEQMQEADKVSANITKILASASLDFSSQGIIALHRRIFDGVFKHAGKIRDYDITKKEWVLEYDTVHYLNWEDLHRALDYDIEQERSFSYKGLTKDNLISHITQFVSGIWQIHAFCGVGGGEERVRNQIFPIREINRAVGIRVDHRLQRVRHVRAGIRGNAVRNANGPGQGGGANADGDHGEEKQGDGEQRFQFQHGRFLLSGFLLF